MKVLITGGAGYIGCVIVPMLLDRGIEVTVLDKLLHGGTGLLSCFSKPDFQFVRGDICDPGTLRSVLKDQDLIIHLAAYVGYPICKKYPEEASKTNLTAVLDLNQCRADRPVIFASTCSNYGATDNQICTEDTALNPVTLYAVTKSKAEEAFLEKGNCVCLRFATAFGVSPRLRLDLLVNDFCYRAKKLKSLIVYEGSFKRPFVHVRDIAHAILFSIDNYQRMKDDVYNVGNESLTVTKAEIAHLIRQKVEFYLHFAEIGRDEDQRNYEVSFQKIMALGYEPKIKLEEGIDELLAAVDVVDIQNPYSNV